LEHTANYRDVMYFFGFGGDIPRFFGRYREQLEERDDIESVGGLSPGDVGQLWRLYPQDGEEPPGSIRIRGLEPIAPRKLSGLAAAPRAGFRLPLRPSQIQSSGLYGLP
jgi:hypothetical protein